MLSTPAPYYLPPMFESRRVALGALMLLPAAVMGYLAFNSGGFFPGPPAYLTALLCIVLMLRVTLGEKPTCRDGPAAHHRGRRAFALRA